jgi:ABC-type Fe3+-siderophore transport system permease subunit
MARPGLVLGRIARDPDLLSRHLFGTVGMFMAVSGATLHRALQPPEPDPGLLVWAAAQKFGSSGAVAIGVSRRALSPLALSVATFDFASGLLCVAFRRSLRQASSER